MTMDQGLEHHRRSYCVFLLTLLTLPFLGFYGLQQCQFWREYRKGNFPIHDDAGLEMTEPPPPFFIDEEQENSPLIDFNSNSIDLQETDEIADPPKDMSIRNLEMMMPVSRMKREIADPVLDLLDEENVDLNMLFELTEEELLNPRIHRRRLQKLVDDNMQLLDLGENRNEASRDQTIKKEDKKIVQMMNPKPPLDLPVVKPDLRKLETEPASKAISTKSTPFHFHIPIISKNEKPEKRISLDELMKIAKKYKDPLTLNPIIYKAAHSGQILTQEQLKSMKRMVRDSPILDFLGFLAQDMEAEEKRKERGWNDELEGLLGGKKSPLELPINDQILQDLIGDEDDLRLLHKKEVHQDHSTVASVNLSTIVTTTTRKPISTTAKRSSSTISKRSELTRKANRIKRVLSAPHDFINYFDDDQSDIIKDDISSFVSKSRRKRGIGSWFKNVFGFGSGKKKSKTTTTTTTTPPPPSPPTPESSSSEEEQTTTPKPSKKKKQLIQKKQDVVPTKKPGGGIEDEDTEVDFLLPPDLRRSTWLKLHVNYEELMEEEENNRKKKDVSNEPKK